MKVQYFVFCWLQLQILLAVVTRTAADREAVLDDEPSNTSTTSKIRQDQPRRIRGDGSIPDDYHSRSLQDLDLDLDIRKEPPAASKTQFKLFRESPKKTFFPPTLPPQTVSPAPSETPSSSPTTSAPSSGPNSYRQLGRRVRVACVGGSLTRGEAGGNPRVFSYPNQLAAMLGEEGYHVINSGRSGAVVFRDLQQAYTRQQQFQWMINFEPDIVLMQFGTDDAKYWGTHGQKFQEELKQLYNLIRGYLPSARFILATPPWVNKDNLGVTNDVIRNQVKPRVEEVGRRKALPVINMYRVTAGQQRLYTNDGVHLNQAGYQLVAEAWNSRIQCNKNGLCEVGETCDACPEDCFLNCPEE